MENHLKVLEERIARAITFIENLKAREKSLRDEKNAIEKKVLGLESELKGKDRTIAELKESQVYLKNRIEAVLSKLESLATLEMEAEGEEELNDDLGLTDTEGDPQMDEKPSGEEQDEGTSPSTYDGGEIYVEENIVDLKSDDGDDDDKSVTTPQIAQNPLFDSFVVYDGGEDHMNELPAKNRGPDQPRKPYSENNPSFKM